jgi:hypothetical protein
MNIKVSGTAAIVFGSNRPHLRGDLQFACDNQSWHKMVSRPPSKHAALEAAVRGVCQRVPLEATAALSVRALEQELSFEATRVRKSTTRNVVTHLCSAQVDPASGVVSLVSWNPVLDPVQLRDDITMEYQTQLNYYTAAQVYCLVRNVAKRLGGVALGGRNVFYIPATATGVMSQWLQDAALRHAYHMAPLEVASSPDTVKHILDQLNIEITPESQAILDAVAQGSLETRSAKALIKKARALVDKIKSYEAALGQQLDWMRDPLEQAEQALAVSTLMSVST